MQNSEKVCTVSRPMIFFPRLVSLATQNTGEKKRDFLLSKYPHQDQITCLNDVYMFNLELHRWDKVVVKGDAPLPRASFGMCAGPAPGTLIVAGGTGVEMDSLRADVVEYNVPNRTWTRILTDSEETPCKFYGQSVCTYGDKLLLFGGSTGLHYTNDLFEYNVRSNKWKRLITSGRMPSPRYKHQVLFPPTGRRPQWVRCDG